MLSFYTTIFFNRADFPSYFRVFQMKVTEGNQNGGDKFNNSRVYYLASTLITILITISVRNCQIYTVLDRQW